MSSLALYRTYRPSQFADVVGQEHVTVPLMRALENDRIHHAYLFSGPRGCGKTSSARILARSLNCEQGPTARPCGVCQSCVGLAPNGPGSVDIVELDAATHGLVDDARELREKAHFAPVSSRFKIYVIDEAHQLGPGAANALLKLIEEPPAHLKFIFATTAPDKILGTIRSRTHHYPFRLIPSKVLQQNLSWICEQEGVPIEPGALALVARAGAGSARDSQSVLGQLMAGAGPEGITYQLAVELLGFTDGALLDEVVEAVAGHDGPTMFGAVDRVMDSGHDPRRFLTDLLERFRDLVVVRAAPEAAAHGLIDAADEQAERMSVQASRFGPFDLIRLANVIDEGITAMKGATPTRLQLELVCARLLLPGADDTVSGVQARLDRLERRVGAGGGPAPVSGIAAPSAQVPTAAASTASTGLHAAAGASAPADQPDRTTAAASPQATEPVPPNNPVPPAEPQPPIEPAPPAEPPPPARPPGEPVPPAEPRPPAEPVPSTTAPAPAAPAQAAPAQASPAAAVAGSPSDTDVPATDDPATGSGAADVRRMWPDVLTRLREIKRTPWSLISQESAVADVADGVLTLAFRQPTLRDTFARRDDFQSYLQQAIKDVLLVDLRIEAIVDPSADPSAGRASAETGRGGGRPVSGAGPGSAASQGWGSPASTDSVHPPGGGPTSPAPGHDSGGTPTTAAPGQRSGGAPGEASVRPAPDQDAGVPDASSPADAGSADDAPTRESGAGPSVEGGHNSAPTDEGRGRGGAPGSPASGQEPSASARAKPTAGRAAAAKAAIQARHGGTRADQASAPDDESGGGTEHDAHPDDDDLDMSGESSQELLARTLGATVISESEPS